MRKLIRPLSVATIIALTTNCVAVPENNSDLSQEQAPSTDAEDPTLVATVDAPATDPERSHYEVHLSEDENNPIELIGFDHEGNAASRLSTQSYQDEEGEPVVMFSLDDDQFHFDGNIRIRTSEDGREIFQLHSEYEGELVAIYFDTAKPTDIMVYGFEGMPKDVFVSAVESDFAHDEFAQSLLKSLGRFQALAPQLGDLDLATEGTAFRASASCLSCIFLLGAVIGTLAACAAAISALSVCAGGPITLPACVAAMGAVGAACGAASGAIAAFIENCRGACALELPGPIEGPPDCI